MKQSILFILSNKIKKMEKVNIIRISEQEQLDNMTILNEFYLAFISGIIRNAGDFLHENGVFFGKWNKGRALGYLHQLIHNDVNLTSAEFVYFNLGFSNDNRIGERVIEIRFVPIYEWNEEGYVKSNFDSPANATLNETVYQFAVTFKDLKIFSLRHPKRSIKSIDHFIKSN